MRCAVMVFGLAWGLACGLALLGAPVARAQDVPPAPWQGVYEYLVQSVCVDAAGRVLAGANPLGPPAACPQQRKIQLGERLPYHKVDWPDRGAGAGYQRSDSVPVRTARGLAVLQTYDFGDGARRYGRFDQGDGGQVAFFSANTVSFGLTEDGGAGLQLFIGLGCDVVDSWVVVDSSFAQRPTGETLARLTRQADRCPQRLDRAFTRWHVQPFTFRTRQVDQKGGPVSSVTLDTLVSEHFGGRDADTADHLERMYFTRPLGYTRWERWQNLAAHDRSADRAQAAQFAGTARCAPGLGAPSGAGQWVLLDCREWTGIMPADEPGGDPPTFWLDRLRGYDATRGLFLP